jgi:hypothetical protein
MQASLPTLPSFLPTISNRTAQHQASPPRGIRCITPPTFVWRQRRVTSSVAPSRLNSPYRERAAKFQNTVAKSLSPERDVLFLRYYAKFDSGFNVLGSSHNGSTISADYCCPGRSRRRIQQVSCQLRGLAGHHSHAQSDRLNAYVYHPEQRDIWGDHFFPTGIVLPFSSVPFNSALSSSRTKMSPRCWGAGTVTSSW